MRWFFRSFVVLGLAWVGFLLSPYVALYRFATAIQAGDIGAINERVNFSAVRISLSRQIAAAYMKAHGAAKEDTPLGEMAIAVGTAAVDPLLAPFLTPEAIIGLMTTGAPSGLSDRVPEDVQRSMGQSLRPSELSVETLKRLFLATGTRGFRGFLVSLPPDQPTDERFQLIFRLSGPSRSFTWRMVGLELPARLRDRLVQQLAKS